MKMIKASVLIGVFVIAVGSMIMVTSTTQTKEKATFAGGCFWCMEQPFETLDGVLDVISGYTGGTEPDPTYQDHSKKGYLEAVEVTYDPKKVSYQKLLDIFWRQIDPTDAGGQFVDRGKSYKTAIFYHNDDQQQQALASKKKLEQSGRFSKPIVTEVLRASRFYKAEEYHQDYYKKSKDKLSTRQKK